MRNHTFIQFLATCTLDRHAPGLRLLAEEKYPNVPQTMLCYIVDLSGYPPELDICHKDDIFQGTNKFGVLPHPTIGGLARIWEKLEKGGQQEDGGRLGIRYPSLVAFSRGVVMGICVHECYEAMVRPEGDTLPDKVSVEGRQSCVTGSDRKEVAIRGDMVDIVTRASGLPNLNEWYASGKGAVNALNLRVDSCMESWSRTNEVVIRITVKK